MDNSMERILAKADRVIALLKSHRREKNRLERGQKWRIRQWEDLRGFVSGELIRRQEAGGACLQEDLI